MAALSVIRPPQVRLAVACATDAYWARRVARQFAESLQFDLHATECVALAASELAINLARYAARGELVVTVVEGPGGPGLRLESCDDGPGILDLEQAMQDGFSTGDGMGSGLPAVKRLMDHFEIASAPDGTRVIADKWPAPH